MQTLIETVRNLDPSLRDYLSSIRIVPQGSWYQAALSFCLYSSYGDPDEPVETEISRYTITTDLTRSPKGGCATASERQPDMVVAIDPATHPEAQISDLYASGLVGKLNMVRFLTSDGSSVRSWVIKTHAGSQEERSAWLLSLAGFKSQAPH